jgi:transketolase
MLDWIKAIPWLIAGITTLAACAALHLYESERDEFTAYKATIKQALDSQYKEQVKIADQHDEALKQVKEDYETRIPDIERNAVANYVRMHPMPAASMPGLSVDQGIKVADGTFQKLIPVEPGFIRECASDAAKVTAFQDLCKRDNCEIKP